MAWLREKSWSQFASVPALLAILALFWLWFRGYQDRESTYLRARDLRVVDAIATHIENSLTATDTALRRLAEGEADVAREDSIAENNALVSKLRALLQPSARFRSIDVRLQPSRPGANSAVSLNRVQLVRGGAGRYLEFELPILRPVCAGEVPVISVQLDITDLLRTEMATDSDGQPIFSDVVAFTPEGVMVSQRDAVGGRLVKSPPDLLTSGGKSEMDRVVERQIFGEAVYAFRQLVRLPRVDQDGHAVNELILMGFVPVARFQALTRSFPSSAQLLLLLAIMLAGLAWPFLRVLFSGTDEPLRPRHVGYVGLAAIAVTATLTLVTVDLFMYRFDRRSATDHELIALATDLRQRFLDEIERARRALHELPDGTLAADKKTRAGMFSSARFASLQASYPYVDDVMLIGAGDKQVSKWSRGRYSTALNNVGNRNYVRDLRDGRVWTTTGGELVAENVRSFSTGSKQTVIATFGAAGLDPRADPAALLIRALSAEMISVSRPILPVGYEFAFFRENGAVVYHSTADKSIDENLFQELSDARPFRGAAPASPFDTRYQGRDYRVYLVAIDGTPLRLAVLRDETGPRDFNLGFVARTVALGALLFIAECGLLLFTWWRSQTRTGWCWPNPARFGRLLLAFSSVAGLIALVAITRWLRPEHTFLVSLLAALAGTLLCWQFLDRVRRSTLERWLSRVKAARLPLVGRVARGLEGRVREEATPLMTKRIYVGLLTGLLVLLAVMPTLALADLTYRWSLEHEVEVEVAHVQRGLRKREQLIAINYGRSNPDIATRRRLDDDDIYPSREFKIKIGAKCSAAEEQGRGIPGTETLLSVTDALFGNLAVLFSNLPTGRWHGSYHGAFICSNTEPPLIAAKLPDNARTIQGQSTPGLPLSGWRPWVVAVPLLFWICWWAVGLFRKRVYGFLDQWPTPRPRSDPPPQMDDRTTAEGWDRYSSEEKDVLLRVARRELVPRRYEEVARRLVEDGLISFQPLPRQVFAQLERCALSAPPAAVPLRTALLATKWRPIFAVALLAAAVFLYFTQQSGSVALVTGLTAIVPLLARITDAVTSGGAAPRQ